MFFLFFASHIEIDAISVKRLDLLRDFVFSNLSLIFSIENEIIEVHDL
jgi:hypothetical protein